jgi:aspartyl-tRNA(Asn)/glutamyl-tRNA(Gln) amidotransferase subunit A
MQMYLADVFTVSANLTGLPAVSLPAGRADGLPVGLQLTGRAFDEAMVLGVGSAFEARTSWHAEPPPLA